VAVITDYDTLRTAVADYMARSDLSGYIPNFVQNFEERFLRDPHNWGRWMESALSVTIASNVAAVPSNYLGMKTAYISGQTRQPLKRVSLEQLYSRFPRNGGASTPAYFARNGENFEFGPVGSDGLVMVGTYYAKPTLLRSDSDGINWLITNAPDLCLYGALLEAQPFLMNDSSIAVWQSFYRDAVEAYRRQQTEEDYGSPMVVVG